MELLGLLGVSFIPSALMMAVNELFMLLIESSKWLLLVLRCLPPRLVLVHCTARGSLVPVFMTPRAVNELFRLLIESS